MTTKFFLTGCRERKKKCSAGQPCERYKKKKLSNRTANNKRVQIDVNDLAFNVII